LLQSKDCGSHERKTMQIKKSTTVSAVVGLTLAGLCLSAIPAQAFDPVSNGYAIVGSDTLEDAVGALVNGTAVTGTGVRVTAADSSTLGSFDATGTGTIITKPYGVRFQRPNGSGDGRLALDQQILGNAYTSSYGGKDTNYNAVTLSNTPIDIVRGSSSGTVSAAGNLGRYTFGRDAIAFAYGSDVTPGANGYISAADMALIFQCDATTLSAYGITHAVIPQSGSGTRKDFLSKLSVTDNLPTTGIGTNGTGSLSCITVGQEHDASTLGTHDVMPMSASRWIAMKNHVSYDKSGSAALGSLVSGSASVAVSSGVYTPVVAYYKNSTWGRDTYLFVDKRRVDNTNGAFDATLKALFDYNDETSLTYQGGSNFDYSAMTSVPSFGAYTSAAVKLKFGFLPSSAQDYQITVK
jgi:hypothetical protein